MQPLPPQSRQLYDRTVLPAVTLLMECARATKTPILRHTVAHGWHLYIVMSHSVAVWRQEDNSLRRTKLLARPERGSQAVHPLRIWRLTVKRSEAPQAAH